MRDIQTLTTNRERLQQAYARAKKGNVHSINMQAKDLKVMIEIIEQAIECHPDNKAAA